MGEGVYIRRAVLPGEEKTVWFEVLLFVNKDAAARILGKSGYHC